jgi:hypothetical protein
MKRALLICFWILTATVVCSAQGTFYFPHIADGVLVSNIWRTTVFLTNPVAAGGATASGTITLTHDAVLGSTAGSPFNITFTDESGIVTSGSVIAFSIPPQQTKKYVSAGTAAYGGGFATVSTTAGTVSGTSIFSEFDLSNRLIAEAGVPSASAVAKQAIFVDTVGGFNIGVAYANPGPGAATVNLSLLNAAGAIVATTPGRVLGSGNHAAAFTSQIFSTSAQFAGTMQITSATPLAAIALRFDPTFTVFTTLPPVTLASLINPAMEWLQQRAWLTPLSSVARLLGAFQLRIG